MMWHRNSGHQPDEILQNQFTAYLKKALYNRKLRYIARKHRIAFTEVDLEFAFSVPDSAYSHLQSVADRELLEQALQSLKEKERYILLSRILDEKHFAQIADELGMSYRAVTSLYYRVLQKLKTFIEGDLSDEL